MGTVILDGRSSGTREIAQWLCKRDQRDGEMTGQKGSGLRENRRSYSVLGESRT